MKCEKIQKRFLEMDNESRIPLVIYLHILLCPRCRRDIGVLNSAFESLRHEGPFLMDRDLSEKIMMDVFRSEVRYDHHISGIQWGVVGFIILASMFAIPYSSSFGWLRQFFGPGLEIPVSIVLGLVMSIYASAGIFSNLEELKKFKDTLPKKIHR